MNSRGIGLYSYEQEKYTTPFQYLAHLVVGTTIAFLGGMFLYSVHIARSQEIREVGKPGSHVWGWIFGSAILLVGIGMGHAGAIFYARRLRIGIRHFRRHSGKRR